MCDEQLIRQQKKNFFFCKKFTTQLSEKLPTNNTMCITFLFTNSSDPSFKYKLILINNRDEFYSRRTLKAQIRYEDEIVQVYGTDIETKVHGTWLALSKRGDTIRIGNNWHVLRGLRYKILFIFKGNLLNVPGEVVKGKKEELKGRGPIAIDFVTTIDDIETHNKKLCKVGSEYNSFNFLSIEIKAKDIKTYFASNTCQSYVNLEQTGFYGFSNSPVHTPLQKVIAGREKFSTVIQEHKNDNSESMIDALIDLLKSEEKHYPDEELLRRRGADAEDFSSIHVRVNQLYGTRTRSLILIDKNDNIEYIEDTMVNQDPSNPLWEMTRLKINSDGSYQEQHKLMQ